MWRRGGREGGGRRRTRRLMSRERRRHAKRRRGGRLMWRKNRVRRRSMCRRGRRGEARPRAEVRARGWRSRSQTPSGRCAIRPVCKAASSTPMPPTPLRRASSQPRPSRRRKCVKARVAAHCWRTALLSRCSRAGWARRSRRTSRRRARRSRVRSSCFAARCPRYATYSRRSWTRRTTARTVSTRASAAAGAWWSTSSRSLPACDPQPHCPPRRRTA
mmetsp:Transcript_39143/g.89966  ORF Transcript_39143/g.89966 Transcript_39143/m.89966 type:complete len:217 (+) Transcript_39143:10-660(+)